MGDWITLSVLVLLSAEVVVALIATAYIVRVHAPLRGQAPFLDRLVARDIRVSLAGAAIGFVAVYSLLRVALPSLGLGPLMPPLGALIIGVSLAVLLLGPISDAIVIRREREK